MQCMRLLIRRQPKAAVYDVEETHQVLHIIAPPRSSASIIVLIQGCRHVRLSLVIRGRWAVTEDRACKCGRGDLQKGLKWDTCACIAAANCHTKHTLTERSHPRSLPRRRASIPLTRAPAAAVADRNAMHHAVAPSNPAPPYSCISLRQAASTTLPPQRCLARSWAMPSTPNPPERCEFCIEGGGGRGEGREGGTRRGEVQVAAHSKTCTRWL